MWYLLSLSALLALSPPRLLLSLALFARSLCLSLFLSLSISYPRALQLSLSRSPRSRSLSLIALCLSLRSLSLSLSSLSVGMITLSLVCHYSCGNVIRADLKRTNQKSSGPISFICMSSFYNICSIALHLPTS